MRWVLAALIMLPAAVFGQVRTFRPNTAPAITSTVPSGSVAIGLLQGARLSLNSTTNTQLIYSDADGIIYAVPTGDDHSFKVNSTDALVVGATAAVFAGTVTAAGVTSSATAGLTLTGATPEIAVTTSDTGLIIEGNIAAAGSGSDVIIQPAANRTNGDVLTIKDNNGGTTLAGVAHDGQVYSNTNGFNASNGVFHTTGGGSQLYLAGNDQDDASAVSVRIAANTSLTTDGGKIAQFYSDGGTTAKSAVFRDGAYAYNSGGSDDTAGRATLVNGTVTVSTTAVEATDIIHLTHCVVSGTPGHLSVGTVTADTSFVINSSEGANDDSDVCWTIDHQY